MKKIGALQNEENFELFALIKQADVRTAKNNKTFIAFTFQDTTGEIDGKYWDASEQDVQQFQTGKVVLLGGKRELYQSRPQVKIMHLRLASEQEPYQPELYVEHSPMKKDDIEEILTQAIFEIDHAHWQRIVRYLLQKYQKDFFVFPAAKKNHHAFNGGLAYHTISMLELAKVICDNYPELNRALLYSGVILHDLGKVMELSGPISTEYTLVGNLVGHIVICDEEVTKACEVLKIDAEAEDVIVLKHMILSHHGLLEYGSPVRPRIMEAEVLHQIDQLDASIQMMRKTIEKTEKGSFSERIFGLENRSFYRPNE